MACSGQLALLLAPSSPVSVPLFIGRLAETPDAGAIWPQKSQEERCLTAPKEKETLELTWSLCTPNIVFINGGQSAVIFTTDHPGKMNPVQICMVGCRL